MSRFTCIRTIAFVSPCDARGESTDAELRAALLARIAAVESANQWQQCCGLDATDITDEAIETDGYVTPTERERGDWNEAATDYHKRGLHSLGRLMQYAAEKARLPADRYYLVRRDFASWQNARNTPEVQS